MKALKLVAILSLVSGCAGNGTYGVDNPNAGRNVAVTGSAVGGAAIVFAGLVGLGIFLSEIKNIN